MKEYQRHKNNRYQLPHTVYHRTLWFIRDYERMKQEMDDILLESPAPPDGMPSGSSLSNEPATKAERREKLFWETTVIETALLFIPEEYRAGVWRNIQKNDRYPDDAHRNTYGKWKARYVYAVAEAMGYIEK